MFKRYLWLSILLPASTMFGQAITGVIVGTVRDASGAIVPGAKVSAKNVETGIVSVTTTGGEGNYTFPTVPPGTYDVSAQS